MALTCGDNGSTGQEVIAQVNANEVDVSKVITQLKFSNALGTNIINLTVEGIYLVDTNLPNGIVLGKIYVTANNQDNGKDQQLFDMNTGKGYERNSPIGNGSDWSVWTDINQYAHRTDALLFNPTDIEGTVEGDVRYDSISKSLIVRTDIPDFNLNVGQEQVMRVINQTGVTIVNGSACRHNGVDISTGLPRIALGQADTLQNSILIGIATHDILNGEEGFITLSGRVSNIHTGAHQVGAPLYLSATLAGGYTLTPPSIVTQIGGILVKDATVGAIQVSIINNIFLPTVVAFMDGQVVPLYSMTSTYQAIDDYISKNEHIITADALNGSINLKSTGLFEIVFSYSATITDEEVDYFIELYDITHNAQLLEFKLNSGRGSNPSLVPITESIVGMVTIPSIDTEIVIRMKTDTNESVTFSHTQFSVKSINLR